MKARHKDTGEIIELAEEGIISCDGRRFCWHQVELIPEPIDECEPSLPSNLYEAAFDYAELCKYDGVDKLLCAEHFKAGATWRESQMKMPNSSELIAAWDEAAEEYADYNSQRWHEDGDVYYDHSKIMDAFKAGAEWMAEQGEILEGEVVKDINNRLGVSAKGLSRAKTKFGDRVIVQIMKPSNNQTHDNDSKTIKQHQLCSI